MLTFSDFDSRMGRRDFLRIGSLGLGGLSLPNLLSASTLEKSLRGKSVVFLFQHGGPPQTETFDPKMTAPEGIRSVIGETKTKIPGVTFGSTLTKLAAVADKLSIVRSFTTGDAKHDIKPIVSQYGMDANVGSIYSRIVGTNNASTGIPSNVALFPQAVDPSTQPGTMKFGKFNSTGKLGSAYAPFIPGAGGNLQEDMKLHLPMSRLDDRRYLLSQVDQARFSSEESLEGLNRVRKQAFQTILGGVADAFDLSKEDPATVARYDTASLVKPNRIRKVWNNYNNYVDNAKSLGKLMLLARRLCEAGCGFVTVTTNFVWDMHADKNNATIQEGMNYMGLPFDHAVSTFIQDLEERGLSDQILLVCCGEMGRTPKVNSKGGRDHWGNLAPLLLSGGGLNMGQVIGQSTRDVGEPLTEPMKIENLLAVIMHTLFNVGELRLVSGVPTDINRAINTWEPIPGLL